MGVGGGAGDDETEAGFSEAFLEMRFEEGVFGRGCEDADEEGVRETMAVSALSWCCG